jgi:Gly-Xaa carboxypeptidase
MEKGSFNTRIEVTAPSGHSMNPPKHTSIGYLSAILTRLEAHPPTPRLFRSSSVYLGLQCEAAYAPDAPKWFTKLVARSLTSDKALKNLEKEVFEREGGDYTKSMLVTTQAADIINGGVKMNVLPENAVAIVNHRIATDRYIFLTLEQYPITHVVNYSSVDALTKHLTSLFLPLAKKYDLAYNAFGRNITILPNSPRRFTISDAYGTGLEPAPISPTDSAAYKLLSGMNRNLNAGPSN